MRFVTPRDLSCVAVLAALIGVADVALSAPSPRPVARPYDVSILGFNDGDPYRLKGAEAEAVLVDPTAVVFRFQGKDWLGEDQRGDYVSVQELAARFSHRNARDIVAVYRLDTDADGTSEMLVVPDVEAIGGRHRYAPTLLSRSRKGAYGPIWAADSLRGEKHRVVDIRDLNQDGRPEVLLAGEGGRSGYYQFRQLVGRARDGFRSLSVPHVDSVHFVDLESDDTVEVIVRQRVGRRGPASQWTYVDHLYQWSGSAFASVDARYPRYHDQETLPSLVGELINLHQAEVAILEEKMAAIQQVRGRLIDLRRRPTSMDRRLVPALGALQKDQLDKARDALELLQAEYPYDLQVLLALARVYAKQSQWQSVLDHGLKALTVEPRDRWAWWWTGVALIQLEERSSALASFHNLIRLSGPVDEGMAFLRARRGEPGTGEALGRVIDQTLAPKPSPTTP